MKQLCARPGVFLLCFVTALLCGPGKVTYAQGYGGPLRMQGIDHTTPHSAASRAAGGTTLGLRNDVGVMFMNPAALQSLEGIQFSLGGVQRYAGTMQDQQYAPLKYYSNFSLLMEGRTGYVPDPDTSLPGVNPGDTVQRPFDAIGPNWSRSRNRTLPLEALLGLPFTVGEKKFVAAVGAVEYADLDHYYQNNNVLSPSILSNRPIPTPRPPNDSLPYLVNWSQFSRSRKGTLRGYGVALSGALSDEIWFGASGMLLRGSTDDDEQQIARGRLTFFTNFFRLDSVYGRTLATGTSDYSGQEFTVSSIYRGRYVSIGVAVKPPATITRKFTTRVQVDTSGASFATTSTGEDDVQLPWRGMAGIAIVPTDNLTLALEYELRSYASAVYRDVDGTTSHPWLSGSVFHVGAVYTAAPWLALRTGVRGQAEVFEPEGNPIVGEPVRYSIYSLGAGVSFAGVQLNLTYEYASMKYQDVWGSAISVNRTSYHTIIVDMVYEIPQLW